MRAAGLCAVSTAAQAQTLTTFVSNSERAVDPGSVRDIQAQRFVTGANADRYTIFEVRLRVAIGSGADTRVRIREENSSTSPGDLVATLTNPGTLMNNSLNKFTAPAGTTLDANKAYWITVNEGIPRASQAFFFEHSGAWPDRRGGLENRRQPSRGVLDTESWTTETKPLLIDIRDATGSTDATLSDLELEDGDGNAIALSPTFASDTTNYMAHVANTVSRITVTPTTNNGNASIDHLDGDGNALMDVDMVTAGHQVDLEVGENTIKVQVTAEDTTTTETYTVVVTRAALFIAITAVWTTTASPWTARDTRSRA